MNGPAAVSNAELPWVQVRSPDLKQAQTSFLAILGKRTTESEPTTPEARARDVAEQYVSIALVQPLLKQLRETSNAAPPFAPTQAEKQFRALTDADLAQRIVKAKQFPLVDRLARDLLHSAAEAPRTAIFDPAAAVPPAFAPQARVQP